MRRLEMWDRNPSRVELVQRARDARLRLERVERLLLALLADGPARARLRPRRRPMRLRLRGWRGYDADRGDECPPHSGTARPPSRGTRPADPVTLPAASVWPGDIARPLRQAA